jgi:hypothetical protein
MALLEAVETGQARVTDLRGELDRVRDALDRTDAVLGVADEALVKAEAAITRGRRVAPVMGIVVGVALVGVVVAVVWRRKRRGRALETA